MNYSDYLTSNYSVSFDYHHSSAQSSLIYPREQMINVNRVHDNRFFRRQSLAGIGESSSGIDIIDEESMETHSSNSEPLIIRYDSPSSSLPCSRQVIIKSTNQTVTISNKPQRRRRQRGGRNRHRRRKHFSYEKRSFSNNQHHHLSSEQLGLKEDRLKHLFDEYSSEDIHREWKPLTFIESKELYQYALDKYHNKISF